MEHLLFSEIATALFLLLLGIARCRYFVAASVQPVDPSSPPVRWACHFPAYFVSAVWVSYASWLIVAPLPTATWDRWPISHWLGDLLSWTATPILFAALWLFWYSHDTIGRYWSIRVALKTKHQLVTEGPYRLVRHPLYTALFLGYLGTMLALQSWVLVAWFPAFVTSYLLFAKEEEKVMENGFGEAYQAYRRRTGMFFPKWPIIRADVLRATVRRQTRAPGAQNRLN